MVARFASVLGKQARGTVLLEAPRQTKYLTPLEADQHTGVSNTQTTRLNPQQHLKTAELLLAHRQHRHHGAPPGTPEPGRVSPLYCRGVSSLYCAYRIAACVPILRKTWSPASTRVPPSFRRTSSVLGATKRPVPMINSAPLVW